ncbi:zinc-binding dehydrogenase [Streptomyces sp. NPDC050856]|uniref:zinc-binding dehydrogenase n=1 Tax=Streptomyces sp. NPDC050856 TaxID=3154939 RepID=UPI0033CDAA20
MRAAIHQGHQGLTGLKITEIPEPVPGPGQVTVRIRAAGLNHRDLFLMDTRGTGDPAFVPGSDGAGVVTATGSGVTGVREGDEVVVNPTLNWERAADVPAVPDILGGPSDGTLAETLLIPAARTHPKPPHLTWRQAAALPLSAVTAYRALFTRGGLRPGEHVLIPGIGGGVATFALSLAKAAGARVTVTSRQADKRAGALALGADRALESGSDWRAELGGDPVDLALDGVGPAVFQRYSEVVRPGGRVVSFGATSGDEVRLPLRSLFFPQHALLGTSMGSAEEFRDMLAFVDRHRIVPVVDGTHPLAGVVGAYERMAAGRQFGKIVVEVADPARGERA